MANNGGGARLDILLHSNGPRFYFAFLFMSSLLLYLEFSNKYHNLFPRSTQKYIQKLTKSPFLEREKKAKNSLKSWGNYVCPILSRQQDSPNSIFVKLGCLGRSYQCNAKTVTGNSFLPLVACKYVLPSNNSGPEVRNSAGCQWSRKGLSQSREQCMELENCKVWWAPGRGQQMPQCPY